MSNLIHHHLKNLTFRYAGSTNVVVCISVLKSLNWVPRYKVQVSLILHLPPSLNHSSFLLFYFLLYSTKPTFLFFLTHPYCFCILLPNDLERNVKSSTRADIIFIQKSTQVHIYTHRYMYVYIYIHWYVMIHVIHSIECILQYRSHCMTSQIIGNLHSAAL